MNTPRRLLNNTALAFAGRMATRASDAILFIIIARTIGAEDAGVFRLGKLFMALSLALSAWGLHELLVRELASRKHESAKYLINYLILRGALACIAYGILLLILSSDLPYDQYSKLIIRSLSLAIFPEALFSILEAFFIANENLFLPTLSGLVSGGIKLVVGALILFINPNLYYLALLIPLASSLSLLVFIPGLVHYFHQVPQRSSFKPDFSFSFQQIKYLSGFVLIGIFYNLNDQQDSLLISLFLSKEELGWYGAAQTVILGFTMLSAAIRTTVYPVMARYHIEDRSKLIFMHKKISQYLLVFTLPVVIFVSFYSEEIINLLFNSGFQPAGNALTWMIWEIFFLFLHIPNARLMLVENRQSTLGWITGLGLVVNFCLNIILIPRFGIIGAAASRPIIGAVNFIVTFAYLRNKSNLVQYNLPASFRGPIVASVGMSTLMWLLSDAWPIWQISVSISLYFLVVYVLGAFGLEDIQILRRIFKAS